MTFIDQTIVAIAVPELQKDLSLSSTGVQWVVNGYLLSLSALFALRVQHDYALSSRVVFYVMAGVMLVFFVVALVGMPEGRVQEPAQQ